MTATTRDDEGRPGEQLALPVSIPLARRPDGPSRRDLHRTARHQHAAWLVHQYEPFLACCDGHLVIDEPGLDAFLRRERPALLADGRMCVVGSLRLEERGIVAVLRDLAMQRR